MSKESANFQKVITKNIDHRNKKVEIKSGERKEGEVSVESVGQVHYSELQPLAVLETREVADMWNRDTPTLLDSLEFLESGHLGMAEVVSPVSIQVLEEKIHAMGWQFAPATLFLCGKTADGKWVMPQLGDFTVLNASKIFPGKDKLYPWLHTSEKGIRAFGLTPASDVLTDPGRVDDVKVGIRFPVVRMVIHD